MSALSVVQSMTGHPLSARDAVRDSKPRERGQDLYVVALDPGTTTGWAKFEKPNNRDGYSSGQIADDVVYETLWASALSTGKYPDVVVCESFQYRPKLDKAVLTPVEVIGVVKLFCRQKKIRLVFQTPAQRMWWTDERLKQMRLYKPAHPHANDAMRHLLIYLDVLPPKPERG